MLLKLVSLICCVFTSKKKNNYNFDKIIIFLIFVSRFTIGSAWISDFGSPDEEEHFNNLLKYSPLHNTKTPTCAEEEYPATLILTADHDDRVPKLHSLKFAATLQNAVKDSVYQKNPILLRVYTKAGHGQGKSMKQKIEESTDILAFLHKFLKH